VKLSHAWIATASRLAALTKVLAESDRFDATYDAALGAAQHGREESVKAREALEQHREEHGC
jgi:hypothetical protein